MYHMKKIILSLSLLLALSAVILWKHIPNFARLLRGEEIGLRAALRRKNQV